MLNCPGARRRRQTGPWATWTAAMTNRLVFNRISGVRENWYSTGNPASGQVGIQPDIQCPKRLVFNRIFGVRTVWYLTGYPVSGHDSIQPDIRYPGRLVFDRISGARKGWYNIQPDIRLRAGWYSTGYPASVKSRRPFSSKPYCDGLVGHPPFLS